MTLRIRHVIPQVDSAARHDLQKDFRRASTTLLAAARSAPEECKVSLVLASYPGGEEKAQAGFEDVPTLSKTAADIFPNERKKLPLLSEVLNALGPHEDYDYAIFTNSDICVSRDFYGVVLALIQSGIEAGSITRRTVPRFLESSHSMALSSAHVGSSHTGHDCFFFSSQIASELRVGKTLLGVPLIGKTLLVDLLRLTPAVGVFRKLNVTFHLGNDRIWMDNDFDTLARHNAIEFSNVAAAVRESLGTEAWGRALICANPVMQAHLLPKELKKEVARNRPRDLGRRLVFSAANAREGTHFLASLLGQDRLITARHEGGWTTAGAPLRAVAESGLDESRALRAPKVKDVLAFQASAPVENVVAEITHMFAKTFADITLNVLEHDDVVILAPQRDPFETALSWANLGYFSLHNNVWSDWLIDPRSASSHFPVGDHDNGSQLSLIFSSLLDNFVRVQEIKESYCGSNWIEFELNSLRSSKSQNALVSRVLGKSSRLRAKNFENLNFGPRNRKNENLGLGVTLQEVQREWKLFSNRHEGNPVLKMFSQRYQRYI